MTARALMDLLSLWYFYVPGAIIVLAGVVIFRWLSALQRRVNDHAERIAHLEGEVESR